MLLHVRWVAPCVVVRRKPSQIKVVVRRKPSQIKLIKWGTGWQDGTFDRGGGVRTHDLTMKDLTMKEEGESEGGHAPSSEEHIIDDLHEHIRR